MNSFQAGSFPFDVGRMPESQDVDVEDNHKIAVFWNCPHCDNWHGLIGFAQENAHFCGGLFATEIEHILISPYEPDNARQADLIDYISEKYDVELKEQSEVDRFLSQLLGTIID